MGTNKPPSAQLAEQEAQGGAVVKELKEETRA